MKAIQACLLEYLDDKSEADYDKLIKLINELNVSENRYELKSILQLLSTIIRNHHRSANFFSKIERILINYKLYIKKYFSQLEVYDIFQPNQRILLFLLQNDLISTDNLLKLNPKYIAYFYPEIKNKIDQKILKEIESSYKDIFTNFNEEEFIQNRMVGENDSYVCKLIREDSVEEFIKYINQKNLSLSSQITLSIFDTNSIFIENLYSLINTRDHENPTIIEYAFYFGSIQIVKYLIFEGVELTSSLWPYAIHSNNAELINMLEEKQLIPYEYYFISYDNRFFPENPEEMMNRGSSFYFYKYDSSNKNSIWQYKTYRAILIEAIQCHNNDVYTYIVNNAPELEAEKDTSYNFEINPNTDITDAIFRYFNYLCFPDKIDNLMLFFYACKYDYAPIVKLFLKNERIDINEIIILH